jgi:hypothetical protein
MKTKLLMVPLGGLPAMPPRSATQTAGELPYCGMPAADLVPILHAPLYRLQRPPPLDSVCSDALAFHLSRTAIFFVVHYG